MPHRRDRGVCWWYPAPCGTTTNSHMDTLSRLGVIKFVFWANELIEYFRNASMATAVMKFAYVFQTFMTQMWSLRSSSLSRLSSKALRNYWRVGRGPQWPTVHFVVPYSILFKFIDSNVCYTSIYINTCLAARRAPNLKFTFLWIPLNKVLERLFSFS
jgi:hypothetical protein